jgi:hypothetical protein
MSSCSFPFFKNHSDQAHVQIYSDKDHERLERKHDEPAVYIPSAPSQFSRISIERSHAIHFMGSLLSETPLCRINVPSAALLPNLQSPRQQDYFKIHQLRFSWEASFPKRHYAELMSRLLCSNPISKVPNSTFMSKTSLLYHVWRTSLA